MSRHHLLATLRCIAVATLAVIGTSASAQTYPDRPVTLIVPYNPGGPADTAARLVAELAGRSLGQRIIIENKPGAATKIAAIQVASARRDGYTLLECTSSTMLNTVLSKNAGYAIDDFVPISLIAINPFVMSVALEVPAKSAREFVAYAKANPGKLNFGSLGAGSVEEIMGRWFAHRTGLEMTPVAYKGGLAAAIQDLMTGRIQLMFDAIGNSAPHYRAGKIRILGVATSDRVEQLADVPTLTEQGYPFVNGSWLAICAPADTPAPIIERLGREVAAAVGSAEYQSRIKALGAVPASSRSPEEFRGFIRAYLTDWSEMTRVLGVQLD